MTQENDPGLAVDMRRATALIHALCDERIAPQEVAELESLVFKHPAVRTLYIRLISLNAGLYQYASAIGHLSDSSAPEKAGDDSPGFSDTMILPAIALVPDPYEQPVLRMPDPSVFAQNAREPRTSYLKISVAAAAALIVSVSIWAIYADRPLPVVVVAPPLPVTMPTDSHPTVAREAIASVGSTVNPVWGADGRGPENGVVVAGQSISIKSGVVEFSLTHGGRVLAEGPADFQVLSSDEIALTNGKLVATVPGGGLTVRCPSGSVKDLGTEFGVAVNTGGLTDVSVFQGRVLASLASGAAAQGPRELQLGVGQAATLSATSVQVNPAGAAPQQFIRRLRNEQVASLDVTDLISGGDGTTRRNGTAVDQVTGAVGSMPPTTQRVGTNEFVKVVGHPFIDGAFVPNAGNKPMAVDSSGHTFTFPATSNQTYNYIWTGGKIPWPDAQGISAVIDGTDYSTGDHSIICTHSNNAITLDLGAVRRIYPDRVITRFRCKFANSYVNGWYGAQKMNPIASAFVLVDGVSRFSKQRFTNQDGSTVVDLPINPNDRFLTLACTDAGTEIDHDWILWVDAKLSLDTARP